MTVCSHPPAILVEECLAGIMEVIGIDVRALATSTCDVGSVGFRTKAAEDDGDISLSTVIDGTSLPKMNGRTVGTDDGMEMVVFNLQLGDGASYRGSTRAATNSHPFLLLSHRIPQTSIAGMTGKPLRRLVGHPWLRDDRVVISDITSLSAGTMIKLVPAWRQY